MAGAPPVTRLARVMAIGGSLALHGGALACVLLLAAGLRQPEPLFVDLTAGARLGDEPLSAAQDSSGPNIARAASRAPGGARARSAFPPAPTRPAEIIPVPASPPAAARPAEVIPTPAPPPAAPRETVAAESIAGPAAEPGTDGVRSSPAVAPATGGGSGVASDAPSGSGQSSGVAGGSRVALVGPGTGRSEVPAEFGPYLAAFRQRIQELVVYPLAARRRGLAGRVEVEVVLEPTGRVRAAAVVASSAHSMLDEAALDAVRSLPPVPLPDNLPRRPLRVRLPIVFDLR